MDGTLEPIHEGYWAALDRWLLVPAALAGMGLRGPATGTRTLLQVQAGGLWLLGVRGSDGQPAGLSYGVQFGPEAIEIHCSVLEGGLGRGPRWLRAIGESLDLAFSHPWCRRVTSCLTRQWLQRPLLRRFPGVKVVGSATDWAVGPNGPLPVTFIQLERSTWEQLQRDSACSDPPNDADAD